MSVSLFHEWMKKAEEDFQVAVLLSNGKKRSFYDAICFHCQQAGEKYLKAYLALKKIPFQKTHDLNILKNLCAKNEGDFELISDLAISLNAYAVAFRYPGDHAEKRDVIAAMAAVKGIRDFVINKTK